MAKTVQPTEQQKTDLAQVNDLVQEYAKYKRKKDQADLKMKDLKTDIQELVEKNRNRWFGDKKSFLVDSGKLLFKVISEAEVGEKFDFEEFYGSFPVLFCFKPRYYISAGDLRVLLKNPDTGSQLKMLDVDIRSVEKLEVDPA